MPAHESAIRECCLCVLLSRGNRVDEARWALLLLCLVHRLVMVVAVEQLLDAWPFEFRLVLLHRFGVGVLPLAVGVLCVEVVFSSGWNEGSWDLFIIESVPVEATEPLVVFEDLGTFFAESVTGLSLNKAVNEISCLVAPVPRDFGFSDLDLLRENVVSDLFSVLSVVRTFAEHALVGNDAHGEVVDRDAVVLTAHDLGSHVAWSSRCVLRVLRVPESRDTQVSDAQVAILVEDQIFRLDVSVENRVLVEVLQAQQHARDKEFCLFLGEASVLADMVPQVTARHEVDNEIEVVSVFEGVVHIHEEWVIKLAEELLLVHDRVDTALGDDSGLRHLFHGIQRLFFA